MNLNKRKSGMRWASMERSGERAARPSILDNQKVERRTRGRLQELRPETPRTERAVNVRDHAPRRAGSAHPFGVRLLEEGVVLAAGLSLILRNGIGQIAGWIRDSRDRVMSLGSEFPPWHETPLEPLEEELWQEEEKPRKREVVRLNDAIEDLEPLQEEETLDPIEQAPLRLEVERNKVYRLDAEEEGLPDEQLEDQAGALRARLSEASRLG
ncbi:MAG: hypothetical protein HQL91_05580 [Magnetococcales bacterium]|nr:hypothetical protein [Magnetococcales bacterium]